MADLARPQVEASGMRAEQAGCVNYLKHL